jgi:hypothetical protein
MGEERRNLRDAMKKAYEDDELTIPQIAAKFGRSYGNTHVLLREAGAEIRPPGGVGGRLGR